MAQGPGQRAADLERVTQALLEIEHYPAGARQMLMDGLPCALECPAGGERHAYQEQFGTIVRDALCDAGRQAAETHAAAERSEAAAAAQLRELQTQSESAETHAAAERSE